MKLAIAYSTKDQVELSEQTFPVLRDGQHALYWCDGSRTIEGQEYFKANRGICTGGIEQLYGGPDAAIVWKLSALLAEPQKFTHIGLLENDVLLDPDWLAPTLELFEKGKADGLDVGAVSPRSYADRVLIQRDGHAVMHNIGAGVIIFTREAAVIILRTFRTTWWPDNRKLFAQLSGIDLATYAAFGGNEQWVTTDWGWEAILARHGLASLALTPSKCTMVGQNPPLAQQGLELTTGDIEARRDNKAFERYRNSLDAIRRGDAKLDGPNGIARRAGGMLFFPHQLGHLPAFEWHGTTRLKWSQGYGPFSYVAGPGGASFSVRLSGPVLILAGGGRITITDSRSGFKTDPDLPPDQPVDIMVPGGSVPRMILCEFAEGAVFYGLQTVEPQILDTTFKFDWAQLPESL